MAEASKSYADLVRLATSSGKEYDLALIEKGYNKEYGARPLRRAVQRNIEDVLSEKMLLGEFGEGDTVNLTAKDGEFDMVKADKKEQ